MNLKINSLSSLLPAVITTVLISAGCRMPAEKIIRVCPGAESKIEALSALNENSGRTAPIKANGQCLMSYYADGKKHTENFPVKLWFNPPCELYLQGDVAFDPKGIIAGCNRQEFWIAIKPNLSEYRWGKWADINKTGRSILTPGALLESLNPAAIKKSGNLSLANEGAFDVLTVLDEHGRAVKKIYIYCCNRLVSKIEYFYGKQVLATTELNGYKKLADGSFAPTQIEITSGLENHVRQPLRMRIKLKSIAITKLTEKQRSSLFNRPSCSRFENVYRITEGTQPQ